MPSRPTKGAKPAPLDAIADAMKRIDVLADMLDIMDGRPEDEDDSDPKAE